MFLSELYKTPPEQLKRQISSSSFTELLIYYSYTPTAQQKNEIYYAQLSLLMYQLRQSWGDGKSPNKTIKDFLIKPPSRKRKSQLWQSEEDMMMSLAMYAGTTPEDFFDGNLKNSSGDSSEDGRV